MREGLLWGPRLLCALGPLLLSKPPARRIRFCVDTRHMHRLEHKHSWRLTMRTARGSRMSEMISTRLALTCGTGGDGTGGDEGTASQPQAGRGSNEGAPPLGPGGQALRARTTCIGRELFLEEAAKASRAEAMEAITMAMCIQDRNVRSEAAWGRRGRAVGGCGAKHVGAHA